MALISTQVASTSAHIDFTSGFDDTYDAYEFGFTSVKFSANNTFLGVQIFNPTIQASSYIWSGQNIGSASASLSPLDSQITISNGTISNAAGAKLSGKLEFSDPETVDFFPISADVTYWSASSTIVRTISSGAYAGVGPFAGIRFIPGSGTFLTGRFSMYGIRKS
jgi:hypothetical protein